MKKFLITLLTIFSITGFADDHKMGWKSNPVHSKGLMQFVHTGLKASTIKPVTDLTAQLPPVYDQGQEGSCTANAGLGCFEHAYYLVHKSFLGGSRQGLYVCELIHDGSFPQDAGSSTTSILWVLQNQGVGLEKTFPYVEHPVNLPKNYLADAGKHKLLQAYDVDNTDGQSIRIALSNGYCVVFGGYVYNDIMTLKAPFILPCPKGRPVGGHEMLIVGHDDSKKLYRVRNSWGTGWADKGYFWIKYADMHNSRIYEDFAAMQVTN